MQKIKKKTVIERKIQDFDFGQGAKVTMEIGLSLAFPGMDSKLNNIYTIRPSITLDAAPNEHKILEAMEAAAGLIDRVTAPRINKILNRHLK